MLIKKEVYDLTIVQHQHDKKNNIYVIFLISGK